MSFPLKQQAQRYAARGIVHVVALVGLLGLCCSDLLIVVASLGLLLVVLWTDRRAA